MPAISSAFLRPPFLCGGLLVLALGTAGAASAVQEIPAVAAASAPQVSASMPARKKHRGADAPVQIGPSDPFDMLRERLAQKLGVVKTPDPAHPGVVRLVSKGPDSAASAPVTAAPIRRKATRPFAADAGSPAHSPHWDYSGVANPEAWAQLNPEFAKCATGSRQSPIDIRDGIQVELESIQFDYQPVGFRVIDNGHTVQVNLAPGNSIAVLGRRYELLQFHFHRPSEERIAGKQFDMVVHLVHRDAEGRLAVVAVLLERGSAHDIVQAVWNNLPLEKGEEVAARVTLDPARLLPAERGYFTYMGSLTTPPCSEGVLWMVMKQPVSISSEQLDIFARLYPMNARPVQPLAGRLIKESN